MSYRDELLRLKLYGKRKEAKKVYSIPKVSKKRAKELAEAKDEAGDTELVRWFKARMKVMSPVCQECGCKVETGIYQYAIMHIAHLLAKRDNMCPSVKYHPLNFVTLCVDHHTYYDNVSWTEREEMGVWPIVHQRLIMLYPDLAPDERRHFPEKLRMWIENNSDPFTQ